MGWLTKQLHFGKSSLSHSLGFFVLLSTIVLIALHNRGVDIPLRIESAIAHYIPSTSPQQPTPVVNDKISVSDSVEQTPTLDVTDNSPAAEQLSSQPQRVLHESIIPGTPRIALYTLSDSQYRQNYSDGPEMSELITSMLMSDLGNSDRFELLDRSMVSTQFAEKSRMLVNQRHKVVQAEFEKLPVSDFTLIGSLFSSDADRAYSLKLVRNSTGQVIAASRFRFDLDTIDTAIQESRVFIEDALVNFKLPTGNEIKNKIAFGHFVDVSENDAYINQGRDITERLIAKYVNEKGYSVLSRTQSFPLLFEEFLRLLQYTDENQQSLRQNPRYLVYGKYRVNDVTTKNPFLTLYLYIDTVKHGRELVVLHAKNWDMAYTQINSAIADFIPDLGWQVSDEKRQASIKMFLDALRTRGMEKREKILTGQTPPTMNDLLGFSSTYQEKKRANARQYIDRSLELNPYNQLSKIALAMYLQADGNQKQSIRILKEAQRSQDVYAAEIAHRILYNQRFRYGPGLTVTSELFESIVDSEKAEKIIQILIEDKYLKKEGRRTVLNAVYKSDQVFNRSHEQPLTGIDRDTGIQVFEKIRDLYYRPGTQVKYKKPRRFHPRDSHKKRKWYQFTYQGKHNTEAILHLDIASTVSNIHINDATALPSVQFYKEAALESTQRRRSNLEVAIDGFSSSIYLDASYMKAKVLLGYLLCQEAIGQCTSGKMVHSWVVDHTRAANLKGRGGIYFNVTMDVKEKDRLIFLAADAVDRVAEADLTEMFSYTLDREEYFDKKYQQKLTALLQEIGTPVPAHALDRVVDAYAGLIAVHCKRLNSRKRELRYPGKYVHTMDAIAKLAQQNDRAAALLKTMLAEINAEYPDIFPYLVVHTSIRNPFIVELQTEMTRQVAVGEIAPYEPDEFMEITLQLFKALVDSQDYEKAKRYIGYYTDYYGLSKNTAIDFAHMYYLTGEVNDSEKLIQDYGKGSFEITNFTLPEVDGVYVQQGFSKRGQLKYVNSNNANIHIDYQPLRSHLGIGDQPAKWRLYIKRKFHSGNRNVKHPQLFAFGNAGRLAGNRQWIDSGPQRIDKPVTMHTPDPVEDMLRLEALGKRELERAKNPVEQMFNEGYTISNNQRSAIKGFSTKPSIGPLQDSYFPNSFSRNRKISVVKERLFEKGYLSVSGLPLFKPDRRLYKRIEKDFPDYSEFEKRSLQKAITAATKVTGAGYVKIHEIKGDSHSFASTLIAEDAVENRHFGLAVAMHEDHVLVCDYKDGLYSYIKIEKAWSLNQRIDSRCTNVAMHGDWAVVASTEKVFVYKNSRGVWEKVQTLIPNDYQARRGNRERFTDFGSSLAILDDTLIVGNPYGGMDHKGEVYVFTLHDNNWQQDEVLKDDLSTGGFGVSVSIDKHHLAIGNPSYGELDTPFFQSGSVYVYEREKSGWKLKVQLIPKGRPRSELFGKRLHLNGDRKGTLLVKSAKNIYRFVIVTQ
ncbi:MAG: FG-GAP repeat protein [Candidatus Thiodiazotropha sp. (ex Ctena orbiculata)]|nr:FG-GAP repeat protein [Candidatus Thiodiazotropha taylori]